MYDIIMIIIIMYNIRLGLSRVNRHTARTVYVNSVHRTL